MGVRFKRTNPGLYKSARWKAVRQAARRRDGWQCVQCGARGRIEVDHIAPLRDGGAPFDLGNLQTLSPEGTTMLFTTNTGGVAPAFVGMWGAVDMIRDPYSDAQSGGLRITALATADVTVAREAQLRVVSDIHLAAA